MEQKVSIVVPVYNVEKYLKRCVDSLIEQSYSNLEILLVDDGSKDNTEEVVQGFIKEKSISRYECWICILRENGDQNEL